MIAIVGAIFGLVLVALVALALLFLLFVIGEFVLNHLNLGKTSRYLLLLVKSLRRNPLRTSLTYLAVFTLVAVVTIVWSALYVLDHLVEAKSKDIKMMISEKWQALSEMPYAYARPLCEGGADPSRTDAARPADSMTWQFYVGTLDPEKKTRESFIFFFALEPRKAATMMDRTFEDLPVQSKQQSGPKLTMAKEFLAAIDIMEKNKRGVIIGKKLLATLNKRVGERMKVTGLNYKDLDLEVEIVGTFPPGRYNDTAVMNRDYLNGAIDLYPKSHGGQKHPLANKSLNIVILQVPDMDTYTRVTQQIDSSGAFRDPAVKCETLSAFVVTQLDSFADIIWGMRWLLSPAILISMALIIANGISISVRERRHEIAVMKVLGFRPVRILILILGEAILIGALSGFLSVVIVYEGVNRLLDNTDFVLPVYVPESALWWGPTVGILTGLAGSLLPAWNACKVHVSAIFARVG